MRKLRFTMGCIALSLWLFTGCNKDDNKPGNGDAVTIYENATIYTCEDDAPTAEIMIVKDKKIEYIGNEQGAEKYRNSNATVVNLKGKTILPGMVESHAHPSITSAMATIDLLEIDWYASTEDIIGMLDEYLAQNPEADHIIGVGFSLDNLGMAADETPTAIDLDAVTTEIPVYLFDAGLHSAWLNSKALEILGINEETPDPLPGVSYYVRYPGTNEPTGYAFETAAHSIMATFSYDMDEVVTSLLEFLYYYSELGFTAIFDAGTFCGVEHDALARVESQNNLNHYYQISYFIDYQLSASENINNLKKMDQKYTKGNLYGNVYKIIEDGTVEVNTAALIEPYVSGKVVEPFLNEEQIYEHVSAALNAGYAVHCHAIGDKAQKYVLDAYVKAKNINPQLTRTIAHNQVFEPNAIEKYKSMKDNIFCQSTPTWITEESIEESLSRLGPERFKRQYLWGELADEGVMVTFGSDYPANLLEGIDPFLNIYCAVMRKIDDVHFFPPKEAGLTVDQALKAYTINGAKQMGISDITGSLKAGKYADFIVIDRDIMNIEPQDIMNIKVEQTHFQGELIFKAD